MTERQFVESIRRHLEAINQDAEAIKTALLAVEPNGPHPMRHCYADAEALADSLRVASRAAYDLAANLALLQD